jgi:hypothetical protein
MDLKKPGVLRCLTQEVFKKPMAEFPPGMTVKEKLAECLKVLGCKNRDSTVKSMLTDGEDFLGLVFWSIFLKHRIQATSYDGIIGHLGLLKWCQKKSANRVDDLTTCWANGVVLSVLVRNLWEPEIQEKISPEPKDYNIKKALELATKHGVPRLLEPKDFCFSDDVTQKLMTIYLDTLYTTSRSVSNKRTNVEAGSRMQKKLCVPATAPFWPTHKKLIGTLMEDIKHWQPTSFYVEHLEQVHTEAQELESELRRCNNQESAVKDLLKKLASEKIKVLQAIIDISNGPGGSFDELQTSLKNWRSHRTEIQALGFQG